MNHGAVFVACQDSGIEYDYGLSIMHDKASEDTAAPVEPNVTAVADDLLTHCEFPVWRCNAAAIGFGNRNGTTTLGCCRN
jgi:hypothetical protein